MDDLKYFLEAASRRYREKEQEGRSGYLPQIDIAEWWRNLMRKREEELRNKQQQQNIWLRGGFNTEGRK